MNKTKMIQNLLTDQFQSTAAKIGLVLMTGAALVSSVEMTDGHDKRIVLQPAPALNPIEDKVSNPDNNMRQERNEETGTHYVSYGTLMRTASRTGKQ